MISRVADHCFWFGRYTERAEAAARMLAASVSLGPTMRAPRTVREVLDAQKAMSAHPVL